MEHIIEQEKINALEALTKVNLQVSQLKEELLKLQALESDYLKEREAKVTDRINELLVESAGLIDQITNNYKDVVDFSNALTGYSAVLTQSHTAFLELQAAFEEKVKVFDESVAKQEEKFKETQQGFEVTRATLAAQKRGIENAKQQIENDKLKIESDRGTIERSIIRLKEGKI